MDQAKPIGTGKISTYNRACDACRLHKVRCLPDPKTTSKICQRCSKTERECVFTAPQKRKQRKRTDTRVAELEREVSAMRALFQGSAKPAGSNEDSSNSSSALGNVSEMDESIPARNPNKAPISSNFSMSSAHSFSMVPEVPDLTSSTPPPDLDVLDRGVITQSQADELFHIYNIDLVPHYPVVVFDPSVTASGLRVSRPTLFLAVIAAAAAKVDPYLYSILNTEVLTAYAHQTVINSEKSLELVQAMIITCVWYFPPGKFSKLKFYEYIHMAATMALDIGLGSNPRSSRKKRGDDVDMMDVIDDAEIERRRTFAVCYILSVGASVSMRRPTLLRYNSWVEECLSTLTASAKTIASDGILIGYIRLWKIAEQMHASLCFDDLGNIARLADKRVQLMVNGFEKQLEAWRTEAEREGLNDTLNLTYHFVQVVLHELSLHDDHPIEVFTPPFNLEAFFSIEVDPAAHLPHIEATTAAIIHSHSVLDALINMSIDSLRALPIFNFARVAYSTLILAKLLISAKSPESNIGAAIDPDSLKLGYYIDAIAAKLQEATEPLAFRAPFTFLGQILQLQRWYVSQKDDVVFKAYKPVRNPEDDFCMPVPSAFDGEVGSRNDDGSPEEQDDKNPTADGTNNWDANFDNTYGTGSEFYQYGSSTGLHGEQFLGYDDGLGIMPDTTGFQAWTSELETSGSHDETRRQQAYDWDFPLGANIKM